MSVTTNLKMLYARTRMSDQPISFSSMTRAGHGRPANLMRLGAPALQFALKFVQFQPLAVGGETRLRWPGLRIRQAITGTSLFQAFLQFFDRCLCQIGESVDAMRVEDVSNLWTDPFDLLQVVHIEPARPRASWYVRRCGLPYRPGSLRCGLRSLVDNCAWTRDKHRGIRQLAPQAVNFFAIFLCSNQLRSSRPVWLPSLASSVRTSPSGTEAARLHRR